MVGEVAGARVWVIRGDHAIGDVWCAIAFEVPDQRQAVEVDFGGFDDIAHRTGAYVAWFEQAARAQLVGDVNPAWVGSEHAGDPIA